MKGLRDVCLGKEGFLVREAVGGSKEEAMDGFELRREIQIGYTRIHKAGFFPRGGYKSLSKINKLPN